MNSQPITTVTGVASKCHMAVRALHGVDQFVYTKYKYKISTDNDITDENSI